MAESQGSIRNLFIDSLHIGDIVWSQLGKYPPWPSLIAAADELGGFKKQYGNRQQIHVTFLHENSHAWVFVSSIHPFRLNDTGPNGRLINVSKSLENSFQQALSQANDKIQRGLCRAPDFPLQDATRSDSVGENKMNLNPGANPPIDQVDFDLNPPVKCTDSSKVLLISILNGIFNVDCDVAYRVFSKFGKILKIAIFSRVTVQLMVEYATLEEAKAAKDGLNNNDLYVNGCTLKADFCTIEKEPYVEGGIRGNSIIGVDAYQQNESTTPDIQYGGLMEMDVGDVEDSKNPHKGNIHPSVKEDMEVDTWDSPFKVYPISQKHSNLLRDTWDNLAFANSELPEPCLARSQIVQIPRAPRPDKSVSAAKGASPFFKPSDPAASPSSKPKEGTTTLKSGGSSASLVSIESASSYCMYDEYGMGSNKGSKYDVVDKDEIGNFPSVSELLKSESAADELSDISIDEIDSLIFVSCASMEQLDKLGKCSKQLEGEKPKSDKVLEEKTEKGDDVNAMGEKGIHSRKKVRPALANKCDHDLVIEANIAEKEAMLEKLGIASLKRKMVQDDESRKKQKKGTVDNLKQKKLKKPVDNVESRKSSRQKKPAVYVDPSWNSSFMDGKKSAKPVRRSTRPTKKPPRKDLENVELPLDDEYIFCDTCGKRKVHGCEEHPPIFDYIPKFEIGPSRAGKDSGRGVYNIDPNGIPKGAMLGPYKGIIHSSRSYAKLNRTKGESGYAWELRKPETGRVNSYVDPGPNPDPDDDWMAMVNCASKDHHQNVMACQYLRNIYYRTVRAIKFREEVLVFYGDSYAKAIKIDVMKRNLYERPENWAEEEVICPYCGDSFANDAYLEAHIDWDENSGVTECVVVKMDKNRQDVEAGIRPHICDTCGMGFKEKRHLKDHQVVVHSPVNAFRCSLCEKSYPLKTRLNKHVREVHNSDEKENRCPKCGNLFVYKYNLRKHLKTVCNPEKKTNCNQEKPYKCPQCGKRCGQKQHLNDHIRAVHNRQYLFSCQICDKRFTWKLSLRDHVKTAHQDERPYECEFCELTFKLNKNLKSHEKTVHGEDWSLHCLFCMDLGVESGFHRLHHLERHLRLKHPVKYQEDLERIYPASCPMCRKRFHNGDEVNLHISKLHSND